mmetsp:Transcript_25767/g.74131  ORF Transcript_25767/g.74131 Transcript_25767/m.74131 type:complete len:360 (+) Transcript_25767:402-1481(+)
MPRKTRIILVVGEEHRRCPRHNARRAGQYAASTRMTPPCLPAELGELFVAPSFQLHNRAEAPRLQLVDDDAPKLLLDQALQLRMCPPTSCHQQGLQGKHSMHRPVPDLLLELCGRRLAGPSPPHHILAARRLHGLGLAQELLRARRELPSERYSVACSQELAQAHDAGTVARRGHQPAEVAESQRLAIHRGLKIREVHDVAEGGTHIRDGDGARLPHVQAVEEGSQVVVVQSHVRRQARRQERRVGHTVATVVRLREGCRELRGFGLREAAVPPECAGEVLDRHAAVSVQVERLEVIRPCSHSLYRCHGGNCSQDSPLQSVAPRKAAHALQNLSVQGLRLPHAGYDLCEPWVGQGRLRV